jgi:hypothetical protein
LFSNSFSERGKGKRAASRFPARRSRFVPRASGGDGPLDRRLTDGSDRVLQDVENVGVWVGAGDGNRTNPNEPNKGVTTRSPVQLESNGVKLPTGAVRFGQ